MAHSGSTTHYGLPQFVPTDKPSWVTDVNKAMRDIDTAIYENSGGGGGGAVDSVNGQTGVVVLDAEDVGAVDINDVGVVGGVADYDDTQAALNGKVNVSSVGVAGGVAGYDATQTALNGKVSNSSVGVTGGVAAYDATQTALNSKLDKSGGSMTGGINMGGNRITNIGAGQYNDDAVTVEQLGDAITSSTAFYRGSFASRAALLGVQWQTTDDSQPYFVSNNDYAYVEDDETQNDEAWRYSYKNEAGALDNGWKPQFRVNESPLTSAQVAALNSGITDTKLDDLEDRVGVNVQLDSDYTDLTSAVNSLKSSVSSGKALIASAVTDKGVQTAASDSFATMAQNIANIPSGETVITKSATGPAQSYSLSRSFNVSTGLQTGDTAKLRSLSCVCNSGTSGALSMLVAESINVTFIVGTSFSLNCATTGGSVSRPESRSATIYIDPNSITITFASGTNFNQGSWTLRVVMSK